MSTLPKTYVTPEQYLEIDRPAERKSEYYDGEMFAMAGASVAHNTIVWNVITGLGSQLVDGPCQGYPSDFRVRIGPGDRSAYPDVTVVCDKPEFADERRDVLLNPTVIMEVLSPSTASFDRGFKFDAYTAIPSLREYVLIASDCASIEVFSRQTDGRWLLTKALSPDGSIELESIGCVLALAHIYQRVEFPPIRAEARG